MSNKREKCNFTYLWAGLTHYLKKMVPQERPLTLRCLSKAMLRNVRSFLSHTLAIVLIAAVGLGACWLLINLMHFIGLVALEITDPQFSFKEATLVIVSIQDARSDSFREAFSEGFLVIVPIIVLVFVVGSLCDLAKHLCSRGRAIQDKDAGGELE